MGIASRRGLMLLITSNALGTEMILASRGDCLSSQSIGITTAIEMLMMMANDRNLVFKEIDFFQILAVRQEYPSWVRLRIRIEQIISSSSAMNI